ncbi:MAG: ABC transporter permease [Thiotrichales bacterium]
MRTTIGNLLWLARRDYQHEWHMSGFAVLALAAVLGPMLILFGLKSGIVAGMLDKLLLNPANLEIITVQSGRYSEAWLSDLAARDDVGFLVPRPRSLSASLDLQSPKATRIIPVELVPTGPNDPLLGPHTRQPEGLRQAVLSAAAAEKLNVKAGDRIDGSVTRQFRGERQRAHVELEVVSVAPKSAHGRDAAFVPLTLTEATADYHDGRAVPTLGWIGESAAVARTYPGFRLYARSLYDVASLQDYLTSAGIEVRTRAQDIDLVKSIDRNLSVLFWIVALIGLIGFTLSLSANLWASIERKRRELSVLRLVGFRTGDIVLVPMVQAVFTAFFGWLIAALIYRAVAMAINRLLADQLEPGQSVCVLAPQHLVYALLLTLAAAVIAAALAGYRAAKIEPAEGLREL